MPAPDLQGVFDGMSRLRPRSGKGYFPGALRRSGAKVQYMNAVRVANEENQKIRAQAKYRSLADAWDSRVLRSGDAAAREDDQADKAKPGHANLYMPKSVLRAVFTGVGKSSRREGLEGSTHAMAMLSSVASAARLAQQAAAALDHSVGPFVVMRSYDLTPMRVQFGNLQDHKWVSWS